MPKEAKKHAKCYRAFTLVELILVVGTIALVAGALVGLVGNSYKDFKLGSNRSTLLQDGQAVIGQMVRILRQAKRFSAVSQSTDQAGDITFTSVDEISEQFKLNTQTGELEYGQPSSLSALTGSVSSLVFTCYDINGDALTGAVPARSIQSVHIEVTLADTENSFTLSGRVCCPKDFSTMVINEFMYNPPGRRNESEREWVEIYNFSDSAIDVDDWTIWTNNPGTADPLSAHQQFGNGSTIIPANGYAVVTANNTQVYSELIVAGNFEQRNLFRNNWERDNWDRTKWNAHGERWKAESSVNGSTWLYQDIVVPSSINSCLFVFWERTTVPVGQTQMMVTIRDYGDTVLRTAYSGQMSSAWTCHTMDLTAYAGRGIRIHFATTKTTGQGVLLLDDVSVATSYVDINATRLSVDD
ncbi:MAG: lamin tail domain-containing protein, partial [Planctomycetota bacterium]